MYRCEAHEKKKAFQGREPYRAIGNFRKLDISEFSEKLGISDF